MRLVWICCWNSPGPESSLMVCVTSLPGRLWAVSCFPGPCADAVLPQPFPVSVDGKAWGRRAWSQPSLGPLFLSQPSCQQTSRPCLPSLSRIWSFFPPLVPHSAPGCLHPCLDDCSSLLPGLPAPCPHFSPGLSPCSCQSSPAEGQSGHPPPLLKLFQWLLSHSK